MAQVPYTGIPETAPQMDATPTVHADVSASAFGASTAQGLSGLGHGLEKAGGELWTRAIALQTLDQQTKALNASADAADKISDVYAQYSTLEGREAMAALPKFKQQVIDIHKQIGEGLESDYARKQYMQESRSMQTRVFFSAAKHAGDQFKHYLTGSSQASIEAARRTVGTLPDDDGVYQSALKTNESQAKTMGQLKGWSDEQTKNFLDQANSATVVSRAQALAEKDPVAAQRFLEKATGKGLVSGDDAAKMTHYIRSQKNNVMARVEGAKFMEGETGTFGERKVPMDQLLNAVGSTESSGRYNVSVDLKHKNGTPDTALGKYQILQSNLAPWLKEAGMASMSPQEFLNNEKAQDDLARFKLNQYQEKYGSANEAVKRWRGMGGTDAKFGETEAAYLTKFNRNLAKSTRGSDFETVAGSQADKLSPNDPEFKETFMARTRAQRAMNQQMQRQDEYDRQTTMLEATGPGPDGKLPTSIDEMGPDAKEAYLNSDRKNRAKIDKILMQNTRNGYGENPENTRQYQKLMGIANDPLASDEARKELLDTDVNGLEMPFKWKQDIAKQRMAVFKNTQKNPALGHAMQLLMPMLDGAGITKKTSKEDYYVFQGALHSMMTERMQNGKPISDEELKTMGAGLLRKVSTPGSIFGNLWPNTQEQVRVTVPDDERKEIMRAYKMTKGMNPDERTVRSLYAAKQAREFNQYYTKKRSQEMDAMTPSVPRSQ